VEISSNGPENVYIVLPDIIENNPYELTPNFIQPSAVDVPGSSPGRVKPKPIKLVFVASPLSTQH
jgi:hypothetical protein